MYRTSVHYRSRFGVGLILFAATVAGTAWAAKPASSTSKNNEAADRAAIRAAADSYVAAYNRGDAKAVARQWSDKGQWIGPDGQPVEGRAAIQKELESLFAKVKGLRLELVDFKVRFVTPDVAVEEGTVRVTRPGEEPTDSTYIAIDHKQGGQWLLDTVRETEVPEEAASDAASPLQDLAWLVGEWGDSGGKGDVATTVRWTKNKTFLNYSFKASVPGEDDLEGTQVIGWDPAAGTIRSWMFDSDGGFGEGTWTKKDKQWVIKSKQVLPDGRKASATNIYTVVDRNAVTWQSLGREVDGQFLPNIGPIKVVRKADASK